MLIATFDDYSDSLNPDQTPSNSASDLDPSCFTTKQKVKLNLKKIGRYLKIKHNIYLADNNFRSWERVKWLRQNVIQVTSNSKNDV